MASRAQCAEPEHGPAHPAEITDRLMQEAYVGEDEAATRFAEVTGKPLKTRDRAR